LFGLSGFSESYIPLVPLVGVYIELANLVVGLGITALAFLSPHRRIPEWVKRTIALEFILVVLFVMLFFVLPWLFQMFMVLFVMEGGPLTGTAPQLNL
jgi:hypothetical protein